MARINGIMTVWHDQGEFIELLDYCNLQEGDLIRIFRQMIDLLTQIRKASHKIELNQKIDEVINRINRDFVRVGF